MLLIFRRGFETLYLVCLLMVNLILVYLAVVIKRRTHGAGKYIIDVIPAIVARLRILNELIMSVQGVCRGRNDRYEYSMKYINLGCV